ncbi:Phosphoserine aminotransferase [Yarrowia sp. E02]|nr:Phosphoserine aminotransferase [Yarrowia sp. E02]
MTRPHPNYYGAGPALLPSEVIEDAAAGMVDYQGLGIGLGEISHRSGQATEIINGAKNNLKQLLDVPDTHEVFFAQGGGSGGFAAIVYNLLGAYAKETGKKGKVDYFITGDWSKKATEEAVKLGADVNVVSDSRKFSDNGKFGVIAPKDTWTFSDPKETAYVYYCDNETVAGVEFPETPKVPEGVELVADMSSNILSKVLDVSQFGLIFGGAQKNIGIAGVSFYIIKKTLLAKADVETLRKLDIAITPSFMDFEIIVKNNSAYNTVSIPAVYVVEKVSEQLIKKGGLKVQQKEAEEKAGFLYAALDSHKKLYNLPVAVADRSKMNIVFTIHGEGLEDKFLKEAAAKGLSGLKGHRSVGGIRISNYNAVTVQSAELLKDFINEFAKQNE